MRSPEDGTMSVSPILSTTRIALFSLLACMFVLAASISIQWFIYDGWLHRGGPLRIVGTSFATILTFVFSFRWQVLIRERRREMLRRFQTIARMNDRIRNALQTIECTTYLAAPQATEPVKQAVETIDSVLREVLADVAVSSKAESV
ncbi:MAG TPA: hypothetical protein VFA76_16420 [Terriglobales bacterium]|nr:hypothetical protein [Terriglobales bacterium]